MVVDNRDAECSNNLAWSCHRNGHGACQRFVALAFSRNRKAHAQRLHCVGTTYSHGSIAGQNSVVGRDSDCRTGRQRVVEHIREIHHKINRAKTDIVTGAIVKPTQVDVIDVTQGRDVGRFLNRGQRVSPVVALAKT